MQTDIQDSPRTLDDLPPHARDLLLRSLDWSAQFWDDEHSLLVLPDKAGDLRPTIRRSGYFALGLLLRGREGDVEQARKILRKVIDFQFDEPGAVYHGTFYRYTDEDHPPADAQQWKDYDPNWRQFIGTTLAVIREAFSAQLDEALIERIDHAIQLAVAGEPADRCQPHYTNIGLMKSALMTWAGHRYGRPDWFAAGESFAEAVYEIFSEHGAFLEYNSPTYYGVNFYALGLWQQYSHSSKLAAWGTEVEALLWRDVARYYHADLKNMCGPYTRSYGMNMLDYSALLGLDIWCACGAEHAPHPQTGTSFGHAADSVFAPCIAMLGVRVPEDVASHFVSYAGPRQIEQRIATHPDRVATAWLDETWMIGAERTALDGDPADQFCSGLVGQYHAATLHWQMPDGQIAWMRLQHAGPVRAVASAGRLDITGKVDGSLLERFGDRHYDYIFIFSIPGGIAPSVFHAEQWQLPGLALTMQTECAMPFIEFEEDLIHLRYRVSADMPRPRFVIDIV